MDTPVLASTFVMSLLMLIGLFFFIRASVKDRTETVCLASDQPEAKLLEQLKQYFSQRAYQVKQVDAVQNQVTLEGFVQPSVFLAVFLSGLAAAGLLCLALLFSMLLPTLSPWDLGCVALAPLAGLFYWRKAARPETVVFQLESQSSPQHSLQSLIWVKAHRDEVAALQQSLALTPVE